MTSQPPVSLRVGVIGGGAAGIVAAKCLREEGHSVVVLERGASIGGVWNYDEDTDADSCTYQSLRTNLPTAVMQLKGFPFPTEVPNYPSHVDVLKYLKSYVAHFNVDQVIRLNSNVTRVYKNEEGASTWRICVSAPDKGSYEEVVDRVVVCNGHFSQPFCSTVKGIEHYRGLKIHSKNYRTPGVYAGKSVLVIGRGPSGEEISTELAENGATNVTVSFLKYDAKNFTEADGNEGSDNQETQAGVDHVEADGTVVLTDGTRLTPESVEVDSGRRIKMDMNDKRIMKPEIDYIDQDGLVFFIDGSSIAAPDVIMFCTGYMYSVGDLLPADLLFPKASSDSAGTDLSPELRAEILEAAEAGQGLAPIYKQVFSIEDSTLAFVGLPSDTTTFQCFELQSIWLARVLSGIVTLPPKPKMYADFWGEMRQAKPPLRKNVHTLGLKHYPYFAEISALSKATLDVTSLALFGDAAFLLFNFPKDFRSATYDRDSVTGKWTRRLKPEGSSTEDVKAFD